MHGALAFFTEGVGLLAAEKGIALPAFKAAAAGRPRPSLRFVTISKRTCACADVRPVRRPATKRSASTCATGTSSRESAEDIARYAEAELAEARGYLRLTPPTLARGVPRRPSPDSRCFIPPAEAYYARYRELWDETRALAEARRLVTWPEAPIRYVPRPAWTRAAAPHLYFLFYRSPAAFNRPAVHDYLVTPLEPAMPAPEQQRVLEANNDSALKLNHVVHHGGIGHHVQNAQPFARPRASARWRRWTAPPASRSSAAAPWPRAGPAMPPIS